MSYNDNPHRNSPEGIKAIEAVESAIERHRADLAVQMGATKTDEQIASGEAIQTDKERAYDTAFNGGPTPKSGM